MEYLIKVKNWIFNKLDIIHDRIVLAIIYFIVYLIKVINWIFDNLDIIYDCIILSFIPFTSAIFFFISFRGLYYSIGKPEAVYNKNFKKWKKQLVIYLIICTAFNILHHLLGII